MSELTNKELRILIAKAKGWEFVRGSTYYGHKTFLVVRRSDDTIEIISDCPDWPTDIAAAWELVEEMRPYFFRIDVMCWDHTGNWAVLCNPRHGHDEHVIPTLGDADTAPRAICLAWLQWRKAQA